MTRTYATPRLVTKGDAITLTRGIDTGSTDPDEKTERMPFGSIGFGL